MTLAAIRFRSRAVLLAGALALVSSLAACGADEDIPVALTRAEVRAQLTTPPATEVPAVLERLERQAGKTLPGDGQNGKAALDAQLRQLRGTPVVVNVWGEWCTPCKKELPLFQRAAIEHRGKVAFLGVATNSNRGKTERYQAEKIALPYPSLLDNDGEVLAGTGIDVVPKTFFYNAAGSQYIHQGPYVNAADLQADIDRYAAG